MSIYVIKYGDLYKIGYSSDLPNRVRSIIWGIPGKKAQFVGHMPGDLDVEAHLHMVFEASRFSGEWFTETEQLRQFCDTCLLKEMPRPMAAERVLNSRRDQYNETSEATMKRLRELAAIWWPDSNHGQRLAKLAEALGWRHSRTRDFYYGDTRAVLRSVEAERIEELAGALDRSRASGDDK